MSCLKYFWKLNKRKKMKDSKNQILKIGDKVKTNDGIIGTLQNIKGKTYLKYGGGEIPLNEIQSLEKV